MAKTGEPTSGMRKRVYDAVRRYPGIHLRGIEKYLSTSSALANYHLKKLQDDGYVEAREQSGYLRLYPTSKGKSARVTEKDIPLLGILREETALHVVLVLLDRGPRTHTELTTEIGGAKSTMSYHLAKLGEAGIVEREPGSTRLRLHDRERIYRLLLAYDPTPDLTSAFAELWDDLYGGSER
ncbi:MAG: ArsR family transcriptional regulator [Candidatus Thermoplasmatota archaeon]